MREESLTTNHTNLTKKFVRGVSVVSGLFLLLLTVSCGGASRTGAKANDYLYKLLSDPGLSPESRFTAVNTLATKLTAEKDYPRLIFFLTDYAEHNQEDVFRPYWLLLTAYAYLENNAAPLAEHYFDRIVKASSDLIVKGESVHFRCLQQLLAISNNAQNRIFYYNELIKHFSTKIDVGEMQFRLGNEYERLGEWDAALRAYTAFLADPNAASLTLSGYTDPYAHARKLTGMQQIRDGADWTFPTLDALTQTIKRALANHDYAALNRYKSHVQFFAMSWKQKESDRNSTRPFYISSFMSGRTINYAANVDESSRPGEVYLRTWGWNQQSTSWYFVFRRVNFPLDPEIHGRWEWAGIYYGEMF
jgi:hypothetical protein